MEVRSLFGMNSETRDRQTHGLTDRPTDGRTKPLIESLVHDLKMRDGWIDGLTVRPLSVFFLRN